MNALPANTVGTNVDVGLGKNFSVWLYCNAPIIKCKTATIDEKEATVV